MNVGEKVRKLRNAKMMSQTELAGGQITRNMISCIENGTATPSLSTVFYLAKRLGVSVGYLLAESNEEPFYRKMDQMENVKKAFRDQEWEECRSLCEALLDANDDELLFLLAKSNLEIAKKEFWSGKLRKACKTFDQSIAYSNQCLYPQPQIVAEAKVYFSYLQDISPTLFSEILDDDAPLDCLSINIFAKYFYALKELETGKSDSAIAFLKENAGQIFFSEHLQAKMDILQANLTVAKERLQNLLHSNEHLLNEVQLFAVLQDLEIVCRETEDYKAAYRYASEKVQLHEQLLKNEW